MKFKSILTTGYKIIPANFSDVTYSHQLFGENFEDAICPNCHDKLIKILSIDTEDPIFSSINSCKSIIVYYCFRCPIIEDTFYYTLRTNGIDALKFNTERKYQHSSWLGYNINECWEQESYYPVLHVNLEEINQYYHDFLLAHYLNRRIDIELVNKSYSKYFDYENVEIYKMVSDSKNLIGGIPYIQYLWEIEPFICPICCNNMPFFSSINGEYNDENGNYISLTGESIQIISAYCSNCHVVGVKYDNWN